MRGAGSTVMNRRSRIPQGNAQHGVRRVHAHNTQWPATQGKLSGHGWLHAPHASGLLQRFTVIDPDGPLQILFVVVVGLPVHDWHAPPPPPEPEGMQMVPAGQTAPQLPQFNGSVEVSTQDDPHLVVPSFAHAAAQKPPTHNGVINGQPGFAHPPQCIGSRAGSMQAWPGLHELWPVGHMHVPPSQYCPGAQEVPHAPQLSRSLVRDTHAPEHNESKGLHVHTPRLHVEAVGQDVPQPPQFVELVIGSMQIPPHSSSPGGHTHVPSELHTRPSGQAIPQAPQLFPAAKPTSGVSHPGSLPLQSPHPGRHAV